MYKKRNGFTILELLIYIGLLAGISLATSSWVAHIWTTFIKQSKQGSLLMAVYCAHDVMMRDMRMAPRDEKLWKKRESTALIFKIPQHDTKKGSDIGYVFDGTALMRIEGNFDVKQDAWHGATKSVLIKPIERVQFVVNGDARTIRSIEFTITEHELLLSQIVCLACREIV